MLSWLQGVIIVIHKSSFTRFMYRKTFNARLPIHWIQWRKQGVMKENMFISDDFYLHDDDKKLWENVGGKDLQGELAIVLGQKAPFNFV